MLTISRPARLTLVAAFVCASASSLGAQYSGAQKAGVKEAATAKPCTMLTDAEVEKYIARGQKLFDKGTAFTLGGGAGSGCGWDGDRGQIILYSGPNAEAGLNALLTAFKQDTVRKQPVAGVGDRAWVIYPKPRNQYQARVGLLGVKTGQHMLAISLEADDGKPTESVLPDLIALARLTVSKLR
jgi:hypothetical protein